MSLWLVRHAQPLVEEGVCYGATDLPAHPDATQQAAQQLATVLPERTQLLCSPLTRCQQLARAVCALRPELPLHTEAQLAEMDFGQWEGVRWAAIPRSAMDAWMADFAHHRFGGAESAQQLLDRVAQVWERAWLQWQDTGRPQCWITHAGVIRAASLLQGGVRELQSAAQWPKDAAPFGGWRVFAQPGAF